MAVIFSTTFNDNYAAWTCGAAFEDTYSSPPEWPYPANVPPIYGPAARSGWGCNGGTFAGGGPGGVCPALQLQLRLPFSTYPWGNPLSSVSFRTQFAAKSITPITGSPGGVAQTTQDNSIIIFSNRCGDLGAPPGTWSGPPACTQGVLHCGVDGWIYFDSDGKIGIQIIDPRNGTRSYLTTSPGAFPINEQYHGIQVALIWTPTSMNWTIVVDNVVKGTGTYVPSAAWGNYDYTGAPGHIFTCGGPNNLGYGGPGDECISATGFFAGINSIVFRTHMPGLYQVWHVGNTRCGEFIIDSNPAIIDYPACALDTPCDAPVNMYSCTNPAADVTDFIADCVSQQIHIIGTCFLPGAAISVMGPRQVDVTFNIVSQTETDIVLDSLDPPIESGRYCVTVTNPM